MEKILFKKIELWVLGVLAVFGFFGMVLFGAIVLDEERGEEELGGDHFGVIGDAALALAELPENARQSLKTVIGPDPTMISFLKLPPGSTAPAKWSWSQPPGSDGLDGYLLLSRYDGDRTRHVVELVSLQTGETLRTWMPDAETVLASFERKPEFEGWAPYEYWNDGYFRYIHPYLTEAGELLVKSHHSPLIMLTACGDVRWAQNDVLVHHSTNSDGAGGYWLPGLALKSRPSDLSERFVRDSLVHVTADGQVDFEEPLAPIFENSGLKHLIFPASHFWKDPMHLNDIEPVLKDGPFWKKGDLFLSFRSPSLVALYRPSIQKFVWWKAGPWQSQHDVDIVSDRRIAVFDNAAFDRGFGSRVDGASEPVIYDFETGAVSRPFHDAFMELKTATMTEGLQDFTPSGHLIVEEENRGRILVLNRIGDLVATYVNRAENGELYTMGWSRYIPQAHGDKALAAIEQSGC